MAKSGVFRCGAVSGGHEWYVLAFQPKVGGARVVLNPGSAREFVDGARKRLKIEELCVLEIGR